MFYLQCKHSCMHNAALTMRVRRRRRRPVNGCQCVWKRENERRHPAASFNWHSDGSFWNGPNIIGRDRKCTLWCILWHFFWRRHLPPSCVSSRSARTPRLLISSSSFKAYKRTDAFDGRRSVSLKLDWPRLLYLVAREQARTRAGMKKKKRSFLKAGPRGPERQMGLRGEMERNKWSLI